jgi:hypothetical protein
MTSGKRGYIYKYERTHDGYALRADPAMLGSGSRHFYIDQTGSLRFEDNQPASANSNTL